MKDFTAIISSCKFGQLSISEANKMINEQLSQQEIKWPTDQEIKNECPANIEINRFAWIQGAIFMRNHLRNEYQNKEE